MASPHIFSGRDKSSAVWQLGCSEKVKVCDIRRAEFLFSSTTREYCNIVCNFPCDLPIPCLTTSVLRVSSCESWRDSASIRQLPNTGVHGGACAVLERSIGSRLLFLECRYHMAELVTSGVFDHFFSSGPDIPSWGNSKTSGVGLANLPTAPTMTLTRSPGNGYRTEPTRSSSSFSTT